jgi:plasmid maintenance system antidote protein VapI
MARRPVHPGEILADELEAVGLSSAELCPHA